MHSTTTSFWKSFNTPVTIWPFNTYGPRQSNRAVIPTIITQIASGKREIKLGKISQQETLILLAILVLRLLTIR